MNTHMAQAVACTLQTTVCISINFDSGLTTATSTTDKGVIPETSRKFSELSTFYEYLLIHNKVNSKRLYLFTLRTIFVFMLCHFVTK